MLRRYEIELHTCVAACFVFGPAYSLARENLTLPANLAHAFDLFRVKLAAQDYHSQQHATQVATPHEEKSVACEYLAALQAVLSTALPSGASTGANLSNSDN